MPNQKGFTQSAGFTLTEILVYTTLIGIVGSLFGGILITVTKIQQQQGSVGEVNQQLQFVMSALQRLISSASVVDIQSGTPVSTLNLRMQDSAKDPTIITVTNNTITLKEGTSDPTPLTTESVLVDKLLFTKLSSYPGHDSVQIDLVISANTQNSSEQLTKSLTGAVARVSAATFDADLIPGGDNQFDVGLPSNRWQDLYLSGNVGIGTNNPTAKLEISGTGQVNGFKITRTDGSNPGSLSITHGGGTDENETNIDNTANGPIIFQDSVTLSNPTSRFTASAGYWDPDEFVVTSSDIFFSNAKLGIGTTNLTSKLTVAGTIESTSGGFKFPDGTTQTTAATGGGGGGGTSHWATTTVGDHLYNLNTGNVGIGTPGPDANHGLDIQKGRGLVSGMARGTTPDGTDDRVGYFLRRIDGTEVADNGMWMNSNGTGGLGEYWENVVFGASGGGGSLVFKTGANLAERMRISTGGNVGIGTANPVSRFHVAGDSYLGGAVDMSVGSSERVIAFGMQMVGNIGIIWMPGGGIRFKAGSTGSDGDKIAINGNGNVGLGTGNPLSKLSVQTDGAADQGISVWGSRYGVVGYGPSCCGGIGVHGNGWRGVEGNGTQYDFYATGGGVNYGPFTGGHEVKLSNVMPAAIEPGLIVSFVGETQIRKDESSISISSTLPTVRLADKKNDSKVFGAFVAETPLPQDHWYIQQNPDRISQERFGTVNALGEGRVWVTDIYGNIDAGDYVTTSEIPGYGGKQSDDLLHNYTFGKVTESINWDTITGTIEHNGKIYKKYLIGVVYVSG